jgi:hypothetical protein
MSMSCTTDQLCAATSAARQTPDTPDVALVRSIAAGDKHFMPSEMGLCQFFHGFQPKFHSRTNVSHALQSMTQWSKKHSWILGEPK